MTTTDATAGGGEGRLGPTVGEEWPARAADAVDQAVAVVRDRAVRPVVIAARGLVFGVVILVVSSAALVWLTVGLLRLLDVYAWPGEVWISYFVLAAVFLAGGTALWVLRAERAEQPSLDD